MPDDVERFGNWAATYERHWMQRTIFGPVHELVFELAAVEVPAPKSVLDVGCGTGRFLRQAAERFPGARLEGVDAAPEMVRVARSLASPDISFTEATAEDLPFPAGSFDLVVSTLTLHHWTNVDRGVAEVARVLATGGRWVVADFIATGFMIPVSRLLRLHAPTRRRFEAMLRGHGLAVRSERALRRYGGQLPVLAVGLSSP